MRPNLLTPFITAPHRSPLGRRGAFFCGWASLLFLGISGCSIAPPAPLFPSATPLPAAVRRQQESARYKSVNEALAKINAKTIRAWVDRWSAPGGLSPTETPGAVRIDAGALARRHPAWILADDLEKGAVSPSSPQVARVLAVASPDFSLARPPGAAIAPVITLPAQTVSEGFDRAGARDRQSAALNQFFASAAARDALRGRDEAFLARRALEDTIAASQRGAVSEIDLSLIPPDVALELTNLRLQLLRTLSRTPAQRAASRAEIDAIEARYAQIWREQTELQAARLRDVTVDVPAAQRLEGEARIEREAQTAAQKRFTARREVAQEASSRLNQDFEKEAAQLRLTLPATRKVGSVAARGGAGSQFFETTPLTLPSQVTRTREPLASRRSFDPKIVLALRNKARLEARQWAFLVAAQLGSRWNNASSNPDRTAAAISILFPKTLGSKL